MNPQFYCYKKKSTVINFMENQSGKNIPSTYNANNNVISKNFKNNDENEEYENGYCVDEVNNNNDEYNNSNDDNDEDENGNH